MTTALDVALPDHPAKFSGSILTVLRGILLWEAQRLGRQLRVLDPMAGTGRIHHLEGPWATLGVELEPEWAAYHPATIVVPDTLPFADGIFDVVMSSPPYGNRLADHHNAKDRRKDKATGQRLDELTRRMTYKHLLGRDLSPNSGASLQWGRSYRELHEDILAEMVRVVRPARRASPGGLVVVNISNHIRRGAEQDVSGWWRDIMSAAGLVHEEEISVPTPRMRFGKNHGSRVDHEMVYVARRAR